MHFPASTDSISTITINLKCKKWAGHFTHLQFGGGSIVISANSFWILNKNSTVKWHENVEEKNILLT